MSRSVPEWIGSHPDAAIPPRVRLRIFERHEGKCQCGCDRKIITGERWDLDHDTALINGGEHRENNLRPMLREHHNRKSKDDMAIKTYNYQRKLAHAGIKRKKRRPMPGARDSGWKITFANGIVRRKTG